MKWTLHSVSWYETNNESRTVFLDTWWTSRKISRYDSAAQVKIEVDDYEIITKDNSQKVSKIILRKGVS